MVFIDSRVWPLVGKKPRRRSLTVAEVMAVGVASDSAQGQVTTSTDRVMSKALSAPVNQLAELERWRPTEHFPFNAREILQ